MLFWAMILLLLMWWILSLILLQGLTVVLKDQETLEARMREHDNLWFNVGSLSVDDVHAMISYHFGSLTRSIFTFY